MDSLFRVLDLLTAATNCFWPHFLLRKYLSDPGWLLAGTLVPTSPRKYLLGELLIKERGCRAGKTNRCPLSEHLGAATCELIYALPVCNILMIPGSPFSLPTCLQGFLHPSLRRALVILYHLFPFQLISAYHCKYNIIHFYMVIFSNTYTFAQFLKKNIRSII